MPDWIGIKQSLNSTLGTADSKALNELLTEYVSDGNIPIVKSIQRGVTGGTNASGTVTINQVNPSKILILINAMASYSSAAGLAAGCYVSSVSEKSFSYTRGHYEYRDSDKDWHYYSPTFSWQVIEFY